MIDTHALPVLMTVLDSEGYKTSRDNINANAVSSHNSNPRDQHIPDVVMPEHPHSQAPKTPAMDSNERQWFEAQLVSQSEECSNLRNELLSAGQKLTQLRHNFIYEVRLLQKAIGDMQNAKSSKKCLSENSMLKEYSKLLIEREKLYETHESDLVTIKELKESYLTLSTEKPKKLSPNRPRSRLASRSPLRSQKQKANPKTEFKERSVQVESFRSAIWSTAKGFSVNSQIHVETEPCEPDKFQTTVDIGTLTDGDLSPQLNKETFAVFTLDSPKFLTRDVAILARHIEMSNTVSQTECRGIDVSCYATEDTVSYINGLSESPGHMLQEAVPEDTLHQIHIHGDDPEDIPQIPDEEELSPFTSDPPPTEVQYIQSNALNESFSVDQASSGIIE